MPSLRQIRLATGLVLFTYVTLHFANHALGNISVEAMESGLLVQKAIWQSPPGTAILYLSLLTHMSLGFWALYARRHFRWTRLEATQLVLGLSIPFLLADHFIGTRVALSQFGIEKGYAAGIAQVLGQLAVPGALQAILLLIVWIHGCLGLHFWLRLKPFYPRVQGAPPGRSPCCCRRSRCSAFTRAASARCNPLRTPHGGRATRSPNMSEPRLRTRFWSTIARASSSSWARRWP